eukprot:TRINITY_DN1215_c0_g2_i1.p1 TRINITY_DN1215_c0_g2~~TRINITY_DN1215_c0_g2_i1.p1  ORF type:complete len:340 (-),score=63.80 TRINITY_DN1215_c0_g2_i1:428-1447(-)
MVFNHTSNGGGCRTSSPAPMRRHNGHFGFDSSISSPQDVKRALFDHSLESGGGSLPKKAKTIEDEGLLQRQDEAPMVMNVTAAFPNGILRKSISSSTNPIVDSPKEDKPFTSKESSNTSSSLKCRDTGPRISSSPPSSSSSSSLVCNFEESILHGRIFPSSQVDGFIAKIGASGSFHPRHLTLPVRVYFYSLCDNLRISSPYMGHIDMGKKGYRVPQKGTIQVTLFNPLGTVVKMFVVVYNLSDMPSNSQTFIRQRTLYMPSDLTLDDSILEPQKWLRYVIHLRFASSKSGKIYLHTDIRMIIFNKSDLDTATDFCQNREFELRSYTRTPNNPKFSPRK